MSQRENTIYPIRPRVAGFSVIELLVASAIIALIAATTFTAISFFERTTVDLSNAKASKNLLTNLIDEAHSSFTNDMDQFAQDVTDGETSLSTTSRNVDSNAFINISLGDDERFSSQTPICTLASVNLTDKTMTVDDDCPEDAFDSLSFINDYSGSAPIHILGAPEICAIHRVTASSRTLHLCPDTDACADSIASSNCIPKEGSSPILDSEVLMPRYIIRESDTADDGAPIAYFVESAGTVGPNQISLVIDDDYYDSFENSTYTDACSGGTCRVPVQESQSRDINPDRKIRVESDSLAAYSEDITITITALETDDTPAQGQVNVSTNSGFLTDSDTNSHILTITGTLIDINDTLETLSFTGNAGTFEDVDLKVAMTFGSIEQSTGSDANNIAQDIRLQVYPNCGCEAEGRTAVTFRLGKWVNGTGFISQPSDGLPLDITSIVLENSNTPSTFYGYGQACVGMSGTCTGSTKQQTIAQDDAIALFLYEYDSSSATANNKYSMYFFDDAYNNNCAVTESESGSDTWDGINTGVGTWDDDVNRDEDDNLVRWGCYAEITMQNIPQRTADFNPFILPEGETGDFATTQTYSGFTLPDTVASWGRINTDSATGGRSDGFIMTLPVTSTDDGLDTYTVNANPRFIVNEYNSLQSWRIRKVRYPTDYSGDTCPATLPSEETDSNAWLDRTNNTKAAIPQHLWDSSFPNDTNANIWNNSTNAIELRVQTAKQCPNPAIFN